MSETTETEPIPDAESEPSIPTTGEAHPVANRVRTLSIFFLGVGVFAAAGVAMTRSDLLATYRTTYFVVGVVVGAVGVLLQLVAR